MTSCTFRRKTGFGSGDVGRCQIQELPFAIPLGTLFGHTPTTLLPLAQRFVGITTLKVVQCKRIR